MKIALSNFQWTGELPVEIDVKGITVLTGESDTGKTTFARAVDALISNGHDDDDIRHDQKFYKIATSLEFKDKVFNLSCIRTKGKVVYDLNKKPFEGMKKKPIYELSDYPLRYYSFDKDKKYTPHYVKADDVPVFSSVDVYSFLSSLFKYVQTVSDDFSRFKEELNAFKTSYKNTLIIHTANEAELKKVSDELTAKYTGYNSDQISASVQSYDQLMSSLAESQKNMSKMFQFEFPKTYVESLTKFSAPAFVQSLSSLLQKRSLLTSFQSRFAGLKQEYMLAKVLFKNNPLCSECGKPKDSLSWLDGVPDVSVIPTNSGSISSIESNITGAWASIESIGWVGTRGFASIDSAYEFVEQVLNTLLPELTAVFNQITALSREADVIYASSPVLLQYKPVYSVQDMLGTISVLSASMTSISSSQAEYSALKTAIENIQFSLQDNKYAFIRTDREQIVQKLSEFNRLSILKKDLEGKVSVSEQSLAATLKSVEIYTVVFTYYQSYIDSLMAEFLNGFSANLNKFYQYIYKKPKSVQLSIGDRYNKKVIELSFSRPDVKGSPSESLGQSGKSVRHVLGTFLNIYYILMNDLPRVILFDETFSFLSSNGVLERFFEIMGSFVEQYGFDFLMITNDTRIAQFATKHYHLENGKCSEISH